MFREFFHIQESPFSNTPDSRYFFMSPRHQEALAHLTYGVGEGRGFVLLTGEVGTGKTTVCRYLLERLPDHVDIALCLNPRLSEVELLANICDEMGIDYPPSTSSGKVLMDALNRHLLEVHRNGRRAVLIIDEAQNLTPAVLEQIRLLTNLETANAKLLQIILIGQPELLDVLARRDMRQLNQRITARYHLENMSSAESRDYIFHRIGIGGLSGDVFGWDAVNEVCRLSSGIPRLINSICDRCLLGAYAQGKKRIDKKLVRVAGREVLGGEAGPVGKKNRRWPVAFALGAAVAALVALAILEPAVFGTDFKGRISQAISFVAGGDPTGIPALSEEP